MLIEGEAYTTEKTFAVNPKLNGHRRQRFYCKAMTRLNRTRQAESRKIF